MQKNEQVLNNSKINSLNYLRVLAMLMILYDHLGCLRNSEWMIKKIIDFFLAAPLHIIQDFGAFGVSIFFLISGFLFAWNAQYENVMTKTCKRILKIYLSTFFAILGFWLFNIVFWNFYETYWHQFTISQWMESITLVGHLTGNGEIINGATWFLVPLFFFYFVFAIYTVCINRFLSRGQGLWILESLLGLLFYAFSKMNVFSPANMMIFVYMPLSGVILAEMYKEENISFRNGLLVLVVNYIAMILCFYRFQYEYYAENLYLVSFFYAMLLMVLCITWEKHFKANRHIEFLCSISLSVYLLHMMWGGLIMQFLAERGIAFTAAFLFTIVIILGLAFFHTKFVEQGLISKLLIRKVKKR